MSTPGPSGLMGANLISTHSGVCSNAADESQRCLDWVSRWEGNQQISKYVLLEGSLADPNVLGEGGLQEEEKAEAGFQDSGASTWLDFSVGHSQALSQEFQVDRWTVKT